VQGLTEALERLVSGDLDPAMTSALLPLQNYADELVEVPEALSEQAHLFPHQKRGLAELTARLRRFNVAILADSVGLGKTRLACALVRTLKNTGRLAHAAIVTPRKLERNWRKEMAVVSLEEGEDVVLVNKDMLKRWTPEESARAFRGCGLVIVEEAHQDLRNPGNRFTVTCVMVRGSRKAFWSPLLPGITGAATSLPSYHRSCGRRQEWGTAPFSALRKDSGPAGESLKNRTRCFGRSMS
jgi:hypothetical protein